MQRVILFFLTLTLMAALITGCSKNSELSIAAVADETDTTFVDKSEDEFEEKSVDITERVSENISENISGDINSQGMTTETAIQKDTSEKHDKICVYVCGAVLNEGVYYFYDESIILDALNAAGGYKEDAARGYVNLAARIIDGQRIYFPYDEEVEISIEPEIPTTPESSATQEKETAATGKLININTATQDELMTLPGVGESKAIAIIQYREEHQGFKSTEDIKNISGIKDGVYQKIKNLITI